MAPSASEARESKTAVVASGCVPTARPTARRATRAGSPPRAPVRRVRQTIRQLFAQRPGPRRARVRGARAESPYRARCLARPAHARARGRRPLGVGVAARTGSSSRTLSGRARRATCPTSHSESRSRRSSASDAAERGPSRSTHSGGGSVGFLDEPAPATPPEANGARGSGGGGGGRLMTAPWQPVSRP